MCELWHNKKRGIHSRIKLKLYQSMVICTTLFLTLLRLYFCLFGTLFMLSIFHDYSGAIVNSALGVLFTFIFSFFLRRRNDLSWQKFEDSSWDKRMLAISKFGELYFKPRGDFNRLEVQYLSKFLTHRAEENYCFAVLQYVSLRKDLSVDATLKVAREHSGLVDICPDGSARMNKKKVLMSLLLLTLFSISMGYWVPVRAISLLDDVMKTSSKNDLLVVIRYCSWLFSVYAIYVVIRQLKALHEFRKLIEKINLTILLGKLKRASAS
ncbi:hypothetical protein PL78_17960 [Yersinia entomophaga]|uniref:Uncharacterized protein n=2 Tax=Yersiniaceae TaxID=1903411 RepID=A0ABM6BPY9_YERET|nr:hypothetical protein PL78_17960 [Yersinia entomophaga]OWF87124.1 hypothetical protein B4914_12960 [Yersinia entomophaga]